MKILIIASSVDLADMWSVLYGCLTSVSRVTYWQAEEMPLEELLSYPVIVIVEKPFDYGDKKRIFELLQKRLLEAKYREREPTVAPAVVFTSHEVPWIESTIKI